MIIPIGDHPNPRATPYVTYGLIVINVAVFLVVSVPRMWSPPTRHSALGMATEGASTARAGGASYRPSAGRFQPRSAYDQFVMQWGYRPAEPSILDLFVSMFLHGGWLHLIGNMLFLWIYGNNVEIRLGRLAYLIAYLATGVAATFSYSLVIPTERTGIPMIGASGAISGVLGFYFIWFPRNQVKLLVLFFPFLMDVWMVSARIVLGFYLLIENLLPFLITNWRMAGGGVAHGAHIGGFVAGVIAAYIFRPRKEKRQEQDTPWAHLR